MSRRRPLNRYRRRSFWQQHLEQQLQRAQGWQLRRRQVFVLVLLALFTSILLLALVPGRQPFEAQVVVSQFSFQTAATPASRQRLLNSIRGIQALDLSGPQPTALTLSGRFTLPDGQTRSSLTLELPYDYSQLRIAPELPDSETDTSLNPATLEVSALHLQPQTQVTRLGFIPATRRLDLGFVHAIPPQDLNQDSTLELDLGLTPLTLTLEGYRLPELNQADPDGTQPLTLTFEPDNPILLLPLPATGSLSLELPSLDDRDTLRWFWGDIAITDTRFTTEEQRQADFLSRSTIQHGQVRLGQQSLMIEPEQFLLTTGPGLQHLRYLQLVPDSGIEVRAVGSAPQIQVGLDPNFPIQSLRANIINRVFRHDVVVAIVSFSGAMVASLLSWLVDNLFKAPSKD